MGTSTLTDGFEHGQARPTSCRCKVRMSGLRKVGMSAFMGGRGPHGNGAHSIESTRTGPLESVAGRGAGAFNAGGSGRTDTLVRPSLASAVAARTGPARPVDASRISR